MRTFSLGAGKDTVVFAATAAANGVDTITNFTAGSAGNYDKLAVGGASGLLGKAVATETTLENAIVSSGVDLTASKNVIVITDKASLTSSDFASSKSAGKIGTTNMTNGDKVFIVAYDSSATNANMYLATITDKTAGSVTVELVGTVDATSGFVEGNFSDVA